MPILISVGMRASRVSEPPRVGLRPSRGLAHRKTADHRLRPIDQRATPLSHRASRSIGGRNLHVEHQRHRLSGAFHTAVASLLLAAT